MLIINDQYGFRKGQGTRETILSIIVVLENILETYKNIIFTFTDLLKGFNRISLGVYGYEGRRNKILGGKIYFKLRQRRNGSGV